MSIHHLVTEVDDQHHEAMTSIEEDIARIHLGTDDEAVAASRRRFVHKLGLGGAVALGTAAVPTALLTSAAAAQETTETTETPDAVDGTDPKDAPVGADEGPTNLMAGEEGPTAISAVSEEGGITDHDLKILEFSQGLELALVAAYDLAIASRLLDSADAEMCQTFSRHHKEHATAFATVAGKANTVTEPRADVLDALKPTIDAAADAKALLTSLQAMEESAAATYLEAIGKIEAWWVAGPTSKVLPVEAQHSAVLGQAIGLSDDKRLPVTQTAAAAFKQFKSVS